MDTTSRRRFLTNAAGVAAGGAALALAAIPPASAAAAPAMLSHPSDDRLVAAAEGLFASQAAIDQLYREYPKGCGDDGEVDERDDCRALFALQNQHIETLVTVPAASNAGLRAKASVVRAKFMVEWTRVHPSIAVSLANDLVGGARAAIPPALASAAPAGSLDPIFGLIETHRTARAAYLVALAEQNRLDEISDRSHDWVADDQCRADMEAFEPLIKTAPTTFAGLVAWAFKLGRLDGEAWMFEGEGPTLVVTLVEALGKLAVAS